MAPGLPGRRCGELYSSICHIPAGRRPIVWEPANEAERLRLEKLERVRARGIEPYPPRVRRTHSIAEAIALFETIEQAHPAAGEQAVETTPLTLCGRLVASRPKGKLTFADIEDGSGRIQVMIRQNAVGEELYEMFNRDIDLFDFVQADGVVFRTKMGEITLRVESFILLSKALTQLPDIKEQRLEDGTIRRYGSFTDPEARHRQRYADLAVNPEVRDVFRARAKTISALRRFMDEAGFLEVETPILQPIYGGAAARPFVTHHNALDHDMYLRISFELYLKRLLVGMYDAVYEIGRDFRNEGVSRKHNPEFTQLEFYKAYIDYNGVMDLTERMLGYTAEAVTGSTIVRFQGHEVNLAPPWRRISMHEAILEYAGIDYAAHPDTADLYRAIRAKGYEANPDHKWGELVGDLLDVVEPNLIQPTFITDYPIDISPLAKKKPGDPRHVERFEFFIAGLEMGNAFTELNDPLDQEARFIEMGRLYGTDSEEAHPVDEDYLRAMRYGMPPNGGFGMGIDRLVMLLTDQPNIREVLLFPALRIRDGD
ncbi:MAG: lysine--tRNA ligase [Anaerolineae bacterium]|nr:lysine--tRNA ligase [Anaerolineae bacterium]